MNIILDGIIFSLQKHGGVSVYFSELIKYLKRSETCATLTLDFPLCQVEPISDQYLHVKKQQSRYLERYRAARTPDSSAVFHSSYYRIPENRNQLSIVTVHDFTYERFLKGPARWVHSRQKYKAIRAARTIICISEATRDDLLDFVGVRSDQNLYVIPNGVSDIFRPIENVDFNPFDLLFVGARQGYKNFRLLLEALTLLPRHRIKCVGGGPLRDEEFDGLGADIRARVTHLGFISDEELNSQYNKVAGLVYPSAYEGFGIPVLEAMRAGCPVVAVDCKAVREVGGDALAVASELTPFGLAKSINLLSMQGWRDEAVSAGFSQTSKYSWEATHKRTLQAYADLANLN